MIKEQEQIIRKVTKIGNGAHIFAPKGWLNEEVIILRVSKPKLSIKEEILKIISDYMKDILGIYLVGSYGRGEETERSDVDVLVISEKINKKIKQGRYNIIILSKENIEKQLKINALPLIPMLKEAKSLLNSALIESYKDLNLTEKNLKFHIETTKSALNVNKEIIKLDKERNSKCSDAVSYSLILRLREVYIIECLIKSKLWNNKEFIKLIEKIAGSREAYEGYLRVKDNKKIKKNLKTEEAEKLYNYILKKIGEQELWVKGRK